MSLLTQIAIVVCIGIYWVAYLIGLKQGKVKPIFATWLFFSLATVLSFVTDFSETGVSGLLANTFNIVDTIATLTLTVVILFTKDVRKHFTAFEKVCFSAVVFVFFGWLISGQNIAAHFSIQLILVIAYLPTLKHLWSAKVNSESLTMWIFDCLASIFGVIIPIKTVALLPLVYGIRSIVCTFTVVLLILRIKFREQQRAAHMVKI